jgi:D-glycero-alpha-D-manno-heptose-7-phosphate kinase
MEIGKDGGVKIRKANITDETIDALNRNMLIFFTGVSRSADEILNEQSSGVKNDKKDVIESMHFIKELGYEILEAMESGNVDEVGRLFDAHWQHKKKISTKMSNERFDQIYNTAKEHGALGGKISGAGGGGFFTFYVEKNHKKFKEVMRDLGLSEMRYRFDFEGSKVIVDF